MGTGQNIKALRKRDQLTQEEFAALIGVSKETVCRWEKELYNPPLNVAQDSIEI
ncbi:MAG: helix-turn-helix domain-containing protein [Collinsella sp.]